MALPDSITGKVLQNRFPVLQEQLVKPCRLAAMRLLGVKLTDLPEIEVYGS